MGTGRTHHMTPSRNSAGMEGEKWGHFPKSSELIPSFPLFLSYIGVPTVLAQHLSGPCVQEGHSSSAHAAMCLQLETGDLNTNSMVVLPAPLPGSFSCMQLWGMDTFNNMKFIRTYVLSQN